MKRNQTRSTLGTTTTAVIAAVLLTAAITTTVLSVRSPTPPVAVPSVVYVPVLAAPMSNEATPAEPAVGQATLTSAPAPATSPSPTTSGPDTPDLLDEAVPATAAAQSLAEVLERARARLAEVGAAVLASGPPSGMPIAGVEPAAVIPEPSEPAPALAPTAPAAPTMGGAGAFTTAAPPWSASSYTPAPNAGAGAFTTAAPPWSASAYTPPSNAGAGAFTTEWNIPPVTVTVLPRY